MQQNCLRVREVFESKVYVCMEYVNNHECLLVGGCVCSCEATRYKFPLWGSWSMRVNRSDPIH